MEALIVEINSELQHKHIQYTWIPDNSDIPWDHSLNVYHGDDFGCNQDLKSGIEVVQQIRRDTILYKIILMLHHIKDEEYYLYYNLI